MRDPKVDYPDATVLRGAVGSVRKVLVSEPHSWRTGAPGNQALIDADARKLLDWISNSVPAHVVAAMFRIIDEDAAAEAEEEAICERTHVHGRNYEASEWVNFLAEPEAEVTDEMAMLSRTIEYLSNMCWRWWQVEKFQTQTFIDCNEAMDWSYLGYLCHMSLTGSGTGLWDHESSFVEWLGVRKVVAERIAHNFEFFVKFSKRECAIALRLMSSELDDTISMAQCTDEEGDSDE